MTAPLDKSPHAPLPVWKLALLLLATATLYQFVWLYRTAEDLRTTRDPSIQPWHWVLIPLLGPFVFIPGQKIAAYLKEWQIEENKVIGHLADPVMVGMMMFIAYLPFLILIVDSMLWAPALVISLLLLSLAYLPLQGQMNFNKRPTENTAFRSPPWKFENRQIWAGAAGLVIALPLYVTVFTDMRENWDAATLDLGETIEPESGLFRIHVMDEGWSRVGPQFMEADAEMQFYGPNEWTWAVVYDYGDMSVDNVMELRVSDIRETYSRATCTQKKTLDEATWTITGTVLCIGRTPLDGSYAYTSRILRQDGNAIEIIAYTSHHSSKLSSDMSVRLKKFAKGLELLQ